MVTVSSFIFGMGRGSLRVVDLGLWQLAL